MPQTKLQGEELGTVPAGGIIMWAGTIANIPTGWLICDGNNGTPNLLSKFVKGVATAATNPGGTGGSTTGGSTALSLAQMPVHEHFTNIRYQASGSGYRSAGLGGAGTAINTDSKGSGSGHTHPGNEPPYYCIAYIMRV